MTSVLNRKPMRLLVTTTIFGLLILPVAIPLRVLVLAGAVLLLTFLEAGNLQPLGFSRPRWRSTLLWGIALPLVVIVLGAFIQPQIERLMGIRSDLTAYGAIEGNTPVALKLLGLALTSAAFGEEILFRGFLLHQLTALLGDGDRPRRVAIVTSGLAFGLAHWVQGPIGVVTTGLVGLLFAWAWFRSGRNLWALILAHALLDSYSIAMLYLGLRP